MTTIIKSGSFKRVAKKKVFDINIFNDTLKLNRCSIKNNASSAFLKTFIKAFEKQEPLKIKILTYNNNSFMSKEQRKSIMLY